MEAMQADRTTGKDKGRGGEGRGGDEHTRCQSVRQAGMPAADRTTTAQVYEWVMVGRRAYTA